MIFSAGERTDEAPKRLGETSFEFLDRVSWKSAGRVREFLTCALCRYPKDHVLELISRITSRRATHFRSAVFELLLHDVLVHRGCTLEPHPVLAGTAKTPDFLVREPSGGRYYLEAVLASEDGWTDPAAQSRIDRVLEYMDSLPHKNFHLAVRTKGIPTTQPSGKRLVSEVANWLDSLDPDDPTVGESEMHITHEFLVMSFRAIALPPTYRGQSRRLVAIASHGGHWVNSWIPLRDAIRHKGQRYGKLDLPLVVAVNFDRTTLKKIDEQQALYGEEMLAIPVNDSDDETRLIREKNGAWMSPTGPSGQRVSGAWIFRGLSYWNVASCTQRIYINPWANLEVPPEIQCFPSCKLTTGSLNYEDGLSLGQVLSLSPEWPEDSADRRVR